MNVKHFPVAYLTTFYTLLTALLLVNEQVQLLPAVWVRVGGAVAAVVGVWLGARTHGAVTPLASPRDAVGRRLVPRSADEPDKNGERRYGMDG